MWDYLKVFRTYKHFKFIVLASQKYLSGLQIELLLGKLIAQGAKKYAEICKIQSTNYISCKDIIRHSVKTGLNYISIICSH